MWFLIGGLLLNKAVYVLRLVSKYLWLTVLA